MATPGFGLVRRTLDEALGKLGVGSEARRGVINALEKVMEVAGLIETSGILTTGLAATNETVAGLAEDLASLEGEIPALAPPQRTFGATVFTELEDVPQTYSGSGNYLVRVNVGATALEFATLSTVLDTGVGTGRGTLAMRGAATWGAFAPGTLGYVLTSGGAGADLLWAPVASITGFDEAVDDRVGTLLQQGAGITLSYNDGAGTLTITATGSNAQDNVARHALCGGL